jgi:long-chain acyl-CoA synthetase
MTLPAALGQQAAVRPLAPAVTACEAGEWRTVTWQQLSKRVDNLARGLADIGVMAGDNCALIADNSVEWICCELAIQACGAVAVAAYAGLTDEDLEHILTHAAPRVAFAGNSKLGDQLGNLARRIPSLETVVAMAGDGDGDGCSSLREVELAGASINPVEPDIARVRDPEALATVGFTSGTTGKPKGVMLRHRNIIAGATAVARLLGLTPEDTQLACFPLSHPAVLSLTLGAALVVGCSVALAEPNQLAAALHATRPSFMQGTPPIYESVARAIEEAVESMPPTRRSLARSALKRNRLAVQRVADGRSRRSDVALGYLCELIGLRRVRRSAGVENMKLASIGGVKTSRELLVALWSAGFPVRETYGMSEVPSLVFAQRSPADEGTIGPVVPGFEARVDETGGLLIRGDAVFAGYLGDPEATAGALVDGWYYTGDLASFDSLNRLVLHDRTQQVIRLSSGQEISLSEVEEALKSCDHIEQAIVIGDGRPYLTAIVFPRQPPLGSQQQDRSQRTDEPPTASTQLTAEIELLNRSLSPEQQIRAFRAAPRPLSRELGELTPTLKTVTRVVLKNMSSLVDEMYGTDNGGT